MKIIPAGNADTNSAIASADAFLRHAETFWALVQPEHQDIEKIAHANLGELVVSATSLALAIEIYFKILLLLLEQAAPKKHDLPMLYERLPKKVRQSIEAQYDEFRSKEDPEDTAGVSVHIVSQVGTEPSFNRRSGMPSMRLEALLSRNADAFITWRYLFAHGPTKSGAPLSFEYIRLSYLAKSLRTQVMSEYTRRKVSR